MPGVAESNVPAPACIIGVVADTHIPDRALTLHPRLLPALREAGVSHILHAGDISSRRVLEALSTVAPVTAVRGNRDIFLRSLNMKEEHTFCGVRIAVMHGHGGVISYFIDKVKHFLFGYHVNQYIPELVRNGGEANVIVFGHTHQPVALMVDDKLLLNPGSATTGPIKGRGPSFGLISVATGGTVHTSIVPLLGYDLRRWQWVEQKEQAPNG